MDQLDINTLLANGTLANQQFELIPIKSVVVDDDNPFNDEYVYDVGVDSNQYNHFFANGLLVHNSCYFLTHANGVDEAIEIGDDVADKVNKSFQGFMQQAFLCNPQYDDIIKCGREVVASCGIFVQKKRYTLRLLDLDGKRVDKMKTMGLELKKTTLPKYCQVKLTDFVYRLLKGEDWKAIERDIVDFKQQIISSNDIHSFGIPKGMNGIEKYTQDLVQDPDARVPGHVRASIHYNECLEKYDDTASMTLISGTKIKVYYLKKPQGKYKSIALPTDLETIPQWFIDDILPNIDRHGQVLRLVDKPLEHILSAIQKTVPTPQTLFVDEAFEF